MKYKEISKEELEEFKSTLDNQRRGLVITSGDNIIPEIFVGTKLSVGLICNRFNFNLCYGSECAFNKTSFVNSSLNPRVESICRFGGRDILLARVVLKKESCCHSGCLKLAVEQGRCQEHFDVERGL